MKLFNVHGPRELWINQRYVSARTGRQCARINLQQTCGFDRVHLDQTNEVDLAMFANEQIDE